MTDSVITISVSLPADCAKPLDNHADAGTYGSSREDVVRHFVCRAVGVDPVMPAPKKVAKKKVAKKKAAKKN